MKRHIIQYKCTECDQHFQSRKDLATHARSHSESRPFQCTVCSQPFTTSSSFSEHYRTHCGGKQSTTEQSFACNQCGKRFSSQGRLSVHMNIHTSKYKCRECDRCCQSSKDLAIHTLSHSEHQPFRCKVCKKRFMSASRFLKHYRSHSVEKQNAGEQSFACDQREESFSYNAGVSVLKNIHSSKYKCTECGRCFQNSEVLEVHMRSHSRQKPFECTVCNTRFALSCSLATHSRIHSGCKPYKCHMCDEAFSESEHLSTHMRIHAGDRPHVCHMCGEAFLLSGDLNRHLRVHTGDKPYVCSLCDKSFSDCSHLHTCMNRIRENSSLHDYSVPYIHENSSPCIGPHDYSKPYIQEDTMQCSPVGQRDDGRPYIQVQAECLCHFCGKVFKTNREVKQHIRVHTGAKEYSCKHCSESFRSFYGRSRHLLELHNEGSWFLCNVCGKKFASRGNFNVHVRQHEDVKPYVCCECPRRFQTAGDLKSHLLKHSQKSCILCKKSFSRKAYVSRHLTRCASKLGLVASEMTNSWIY